MAWLARKSQSTGLVPKDADATSKDETDKKDHESSVVFEDDEDDEDDAEEGQEGEEDEEDSVRPITRSTSFSSSRSRRSVHFTNPVSDAMGSESDDIDDNDEEAEDRSFTPRAGTPPPGGGRRWSLPSGVLAFVPTAPVEYIGRAHLGEDGLNEIQVREARMDDFADLVAPYMASLNAEEAEDLDAEEADDLDAEEDLDGDLGASLGPDLDRHEEEGQ